MKLSVPHASIDRVLYALHRAELEHVLLQRTGTGWILEMMRSPGVELAPLVALGAQELSTAPRDTSTGQQAGPECFR